MAKFKNSQNIKEIEYSFDVYPYCPLGSENYAARVTVRMTPNEWIMDYCDETQFAKSLNEKEFIVEDLIATIKERLISKYQPKELTVIAEARTTNHFPVKVTI